MLGRMAAFATPKQGRKCKWNMAKPAYDPASGEWRAKNFSAWWLPELTLCRKIGGTIYSVSGSYEGMETLDKKLGRILEQTLDEEGLHP